MASGRSKRVLNATPNLEHEIERNREQEEWEKVSFFHHHKLALVIYQ
jgi:hypothetical protein